MYPDLLNLYGDKGNIECLKKRLNWRNIGANVRTCTFTDDKIDLSDTDIVFLGGGSDREQKIVCEALLKQKEQLKEYVENGGVLIAVCGGYQLLGKYYQLEDETIPGLEILDIYTKQGKKRLIGNIVLHNDDIDADIVGFENHGGRTYTGDYKPLGKVVKGFGNTGNTGYEGVIYKNVFATYLHGPLLPKNPKLCDEILSRALHKKYEDFKELQSLDDDMENTANEYMKKIILQSK
jgi:hypothetical protein